MNQSDIQFIIVSVVLFIGAIAFGACAYGYWCSKRKIASIEGAQSSEIDDLEEGYWKVSGRVVALEEPLVSPITREPCVFFSFKVEEQRTRTVKTHVPAGPHGSTRVQTRTETYWATVIDDTQAVSCAVKDKSGEAEIDLLDAETVLSPSGHSSSGTFKNCPAHLQKTLSKQYGFSTKGLVFNKSLRYTETIIREGDKLFVIGDVEMSRGEPCFVRGSQPFIVSDRSEAKLVKHYKTRAAWSLVGAIASIILAPGLVLVLSFVVFKDKDVQPNAQALAVADPNGVDGAAARDFQMPVPPARNEGFGRDPARNGGDGNGKMTASGSVASRPQDPMDAQPAAGPGLEVGAGLPELPGRQEKARDPKHYWRDPSKELPEVAVPWRLQPDLGQVVDPPKSVWNAIPLGFLHKTVTFPALLSPFAAVNPKMPRGQNEVDGLTVVYDLRTGKPLGKPFVAKVQQGEKAALSPDGAFIAGRATQTGVGVIETATGKSRLIEAAQGREFAFPVAFVGPDRLLTMSHEGQLPDPSEKSDYRVWDVKTGDLVSSFGFDLVYRPKWAGLSNGGRYLVFQEAKTIIGYRLVAFDLSNGQVAGDVMFQPRSEGFGQAAGIVFSPDGKEFAMLWRLGKRPDHWGQVIVFDATTGKRIAAHSLGYVTGSIDSLWSEGGMDCIQWIPDGSGWLIFGHLMMDRKTGEIVGRVGNEPKWSGDMPPRRFIGPSLVSTTFTSGLDTGLTLIPTRAGTK